MTAKEARAKLKDEEGTVIECCDFGSFFGFVFGEPGEEIGTAYTCVDKKTERIFGFDPCEDFDLFMNSVQVPLSSL